MNRLVTRTLLVLTPALYAAGALAHPGHLPQETSASFVEGLLHPLNGLDHLLAMLAVGIYGALSAAHAREAWRAPLTFAALLLVGAFAGFRGIHLPLVEPMIAVSVLILGLLVMRRKTLATHFGLPLIGGFALFHGLAHGSEIPGANGLMDAVPFLGGMLLTTVGLQTCGLAAGFLMRERGRNVLQLAGAVFSLAGLGLLLHLV